MKIKSFYKILSLKGKIIASVVFVFILLIVIFGFYNIFSSLKTKTKESILEERRKKLDDSKKELIKKVSKLILLPENIEPEISNVINPDLLIKEQPNLFFGVEKNDKVLKYKTGDKIKIIIYSPRRNIIVSMITAETDKKETDKKETDKKETDKKETDKKETDKKNKL